MNYKYIQVTSRKKVLHMLTLLISSIHLFKVIYSKMPLLLRQRSGNSNTVYLK